MSFSSKPKYVDAATQLPETPLHNIISGPGGTTYLYVHQGMPAPFIEYTVKKEPVEEIENTYENNYERDINQDIIQNIPALPTTSVQPYRTRFDIESLIGPSHSRQNISLDQSLSHEQQKEINEQPIQIKEENDNENYQDMHNQFQRNTAMPNYQPLHVNIDQNPTIPDYFSWPSTFSHNWFNPDISHMPTDGFPIQTSKVSPMITMDEQLNVFQAREQSSLIAKYSKSVHVQQSNLITKQQNHFSCLQSTTVVDIHTVSSVVLSNVQIQPNCTSEQAIQLSVGTKTEIPQVINTYSSNVENSASEVYYMKECQSSILNLCNINSHEQNIPESTKWMASQYHDHMFQETSYAYEEKQRFGHSSTVIHRTDCCSIKSREKIDHFYSESGGNTQYPATEQQVGLNVVSDQCDGDFPSNASIELPALISLENGDESDIIVVEDEDSVNPQNENEIDNKNKVHRSSESVFFDEDTIRDPLQSSTLLSPSSAGTSSLTEYGYSSGVIQRKRVRSESPECDYLNNLVTSDNPAKRLMSFPEDTDTK